jgi:hypothetical protein
VIGLIAIDLAGSGVLVAQCSTGNGLFYVVVGRPIGDELTRR